VTTDTDSGSSSGGVSGGIIAVILIIVLLVIFGGAWVAINLVAKYKPESKIGKRFNEWKARRALSKE